ncbi:MAG: serine/threonine protein kinase, partial [Deltaproteobacteria bacterium]|nr:serine/threonine protein kinase [Deltaproteobacteria bacterium]
IRNGIAIDAHNRFRVLRHLGSGGFGDAYLVQDTQIDREVVVKIPKRNSRGPYQNPQQIAYEMREQIQHEMNIGAHLDSSYAAWIIDSVPLREELIQQLFPNSQTSEPFSVPIMEYVEGKSLHDMLYELRAGVYSFGYLLEDPRARLNLFSDICEAIYSAHKRGIAHRDIKPDHIIINRDQETGRFRVRILDWGIAIHTKNYRPNLLHLRVQGTPGYIAPEISRKGMSTDYLSSDQFALGVILYQLMTYRHPYSQFRPGKPEANEPALVPIQHGREPSLINDALMNTDGGNQLVPHFREVILEEHPSFFYSIEALARRAFSFKIQERFPSVLHFREAVLMHYPHEEYQQIQQIRQAMTHLSSEIEKAWAPFHLGKQIDLEQWDQMDSGLIRFVEQRAEWRAKAESLIGDLKGLIPKLSQPALAHSMISELAWQLFVDTSPHDAHNLGRYRRLILENHVVADRESLGAMTVEALQEPISLQFNTVDFETGQSIDPAQVQLNVLPIVYETRGGRNVPFFKLGAALFSGSIDTFHSDQRLPAGGYLFEIEATGYAPMRIPIEIEYDQVRDCLRRESVLQKEIRFISESRVPEGMDLIHEGRGYLGYNFYENPGVHPVDVYSLPERRFSYPTFAVSHVPASIQDYFGFLQSELEVLNTSMKSGASSQKIRSQAEKIRQLLPRNQEAILDPLPEDPIDYFNNRNRLLYWNIQALEHEGKFEFVLQDPTTHLDPNNDPIFWNQSITAITGESALAFVRFMAQKTGLPLELIDEDLNEILVRNGRRDRFVFGDRFHPAYIVSRLSLRDPIRDSYPQRMGTHPLGDEMNRDRSLFGPIEVMGNTRKFVRTQFGEGRTIGVAGGGVRNAYGPFFNPASRTSMRNNKADNSTGSIRMILRFPRLNP